MDDHEVVDLRVGRDVLTRVAEGVRTHQSELLQNNSVVVQGPAGVLLVDPGITGDEMACLANDLRELGQPVVAGFSTHPDWDHVLWHARLGEAPRYGTARCATFMRELLSDADLRARVAEVRVPEHVVPISMRREACHDRLAQLAKVVREAGHFGACYPGVDEQHAGPALYNNGIVLE